jgi:hypothetical protein
VGAELPTCMHACTWGHILQLACMHAVAYNMHACMRACRIYRSMHAGRSNERRRREGSGWYRISAHLQTAENVSELLESLRKFMPRREDCIQKAEHGVHCRLAARCPPSVRPSHRVPQKACMEQHVSRVSHVAPSFLIFSMRAAVWPYFGTSKPPAA